MSNNPNTFAGPSTLSSDASSLHYHRCWWAWCRHDFYTKQDLLDHVVAAHVQSARPVRLTDIYALQTAEDSYWDSQYFENLQTSLPKLQSQQANQFQEESICQGIDMPSSLPSPPASSPQDPGTPVPVQSLNDEPPQVFPSSKSPHVPITPSSKQYLVDAHMSTPSFTSLSSQLDSPEKALYNNPLSPPFDLLVAQATNRALSLPENEESNDAVDSLSEDSSQESVFNQLTQGLDDEEKSQKSEGRSRNRGDTTDTDTSFGDKPNKSAPSEHGDSQVILSNNSSPGLSENRGLSPPRQNPPLRVKTRKLSFVPPLTSPMHPFPTSVPRQSWYQPRRRRSSKQKSASEASGSFSSPASSPIARPATPITSPISAHILPAAIQTVQSTTSLISPFAQSPSQAQSRMRQSQEEDWTQTYSYPPLQTQAPLRSQSLSQDSS
ncbi:hypothetical protein NP233_g614 [Leucocoprinus birnbaumii]|uniref:C2H2-type domain-containing protein n=1 Tax=Leucocoprinus birnbaumii TaxID=56174 RepID=A0AAD5W2L5_9AGAR|nr:hypothetical protein NP233_g614 [Leucocoprinus birnbaumii]